MRLRLGELRLATRSCGASALVTRHETGILSAGPTPARAAVRRRPGASDGAGAAGPGSRAATLPAGSGLARRTASSTAAFRLAGVAHVVELASGRPRNAGHALQVRLLEADRDDIDDELGLAFAASAAAAQESCWQLSGPSCSRMMLAGCRAAPASRPRGWPAPAGPCRVGLSLSTRRHEALAGTSRVGWAYYLHVAAVGAAALAEGHETDAALRAEWRECLAQRLARKVDLGGAIRRQRAPHGARPVDDDDGRRRGAGVCCGSLGLRLSGEKMPMLPAA